MNLSELFTLLLILFTSYGYSYFLAKKLPKGTPRLLSMLGVFYALFTIPWYFPSSMFLRAFTSFFISWISSFKLIRFSLDNGDLFLCNTFFDFTAIAVFPLKFKPSPSHSSPSPLFRIFLSLLAISTLLFCYQGITLVFSIFTVVIFYVLCSMPHLEAIPLLNKPLGSTSLQVFWGRRWNRISSIILRETIYDPVRVSLKPYIEEEGVRRVFALIMALTISGVMHEIMFYHMTCGMKPSWEVTYFFVLQGFCIAIEIGIKRLWVRTLGWSPIHPVVSVCLTDGFLLTPSYWFLVLPVLRIADRGCKLN